MNEYETQANEFLTITGATMTIDFLKYNYHFEGDQTKRDIYRVSIFKGSRNYTFAFGNSIANSGLQVVNKNSGKLGFVIPTDDYMRITKNETDTKILKFKLNYDRSVKLRYNLEACDKLVPPKKPTAYDILACLTTYDPGSFNDFCDEYGYGYDSISAEKTYKAVIKEYEGLSMLFNDDELELLSEVN